MHYANGKCLTNEIPKSSEEQNLSRSKNHKKDLQPDNNISSEATNKKVDGKDVTCKGCLKIYKKLLVHLNSKNGAKCKAFYSSEEMEKPNKWKVYYERNKEKILARKKAYHTENKDKIKKRKKNNYDDNSEKIKKRKTDHYDVNSGKIKNKRKEHYDDNLEKIKKGKKDHYSKKKEKWKNLSLQECLNIFKREIVWGAIYPCI